MNEAIQPKDEADQYIEGAKRYCVANNLDPSELKFRRVKIAELSKEQLIVLLARESLRKDQRLEGQIVAVPDIDAIAVDAQSPLQYVERKVREWGGDCGICDFEFEEKALQDGAIVVIRTWLPGYAKEDFFSGCFMANGSFFIPVDELVNKDGSWSEERLRQQWLVFMGVVWENVTQYNARFDASVAAWIDEKDRSVNGASKRIEYLRARFKETCGFDCTELDYRGFPVRDFSKEQIIALLASKCAWEFGPGFDTGDSREIYV